MLLSLPPAAVGARAGHSHHQMVADDPVHQGIGPSLAEARPRSLAELGRCIDFDLVFPSILNSEMTDASCRENQCSGGCCRIYLHLICDSNNQYPELACVCNSETQDPDNFVSTAVPTTTTNGGTAATDGGDNDQTTSTNTDASTSTEEPFILAGMEPNVTMTQSQPPTIKSSLEPTSKPTLNPATAPPADNSMKPTLNPATAPPADNSVEDNRSPTSCTGGSWYHNHPNYMFFKKCERSSDCRGVAGYECCLVDYCICGENPSGLESRCV